MYKTFETLLKKRGITPYKIWKETGVTQTVLSNWKHGKSVPNAANLYKIASYLGVYVDDLICEEDFQLSSIMLEESMDEYDVCKNHALYDLIKDARNADPRDIKIIHHLLLDLKERDQKNH